MIFQRSISAESTSIYSNEWEDKRTVTWEIWKPGSPDKVFSAKQRAACLSSSHCVLVANAPKYPSTSSRPYLLCRATPFGFNKNIDSWFISPGHRLCYTIPNFSNLLPMLYAFLQYFCDVYGSMFMLRLLLFVWKVYFS
jgi:hypothetical protein